MSPFLHFSFALALCCLIRPTLSVEGNCGSAEIEILQEGPGLAFIILEVQLTNPPLIPPLIFVSATGYWFNELSRDVGAINSPGGRGPHYDRQILYFTDEWIVRTGAGPVLVGFPFITAVSPFGYCTGLFPQKREFITNEVGDDNIALSKTVVPMNRVEKDDVAFVIDTTGSMSDDIAAVKANINSILNKLEATSADFRAAVVGYNDPSVSVLSGFTSNRATITSAVNRLSASGGGDTPEHVYGGIRAALNLNWRPDSARKIIVLGDAPPKDPEPGSGLTRASILALANQVQITVDPSPSTRQLNVTARMESGPVTVTVPFPEYVRFMMIPIGSSGSTRASFEALASGTGGKVFPVTGASGILSAFESAIEEASSQSGGSAEPVSEPSGPVERLILTSICWQSSSSHILRVRNPNSFDVAYDWEVYRTSIKGSGVAKPGDNFFRADGISRRATVKLYWRNETGARKSRTKALNTRNC